MEDLTGKVLGFFLKSLITLFLVFKAIAKKEVVYLLFIPSDLKVCSGKNFFFVFCFLLFFLFFFVSLPLPQYMVTRITTQHLTSLNHHMISHMPKNDNRRFTKFIWPGKIRHTPRRFRHIRTILNSHFKVFLQIRRNWKLPFIIEIYCSFILDLVSNYRG